MNFNLGGLGQGLSNIGGKIKGGFQTMGGNLKNTWNGMEDNQKSAFLQKLMGGMQQTNSFNTPLQVSNVDYSWTLQPTQGRNNYNGF